MSKDAKLIAQLIDEVSAYLDKQQNLNALWAEMEDHMKVSYIAEKLGDGTLVPRHLRAARLLLTEIVVAEQALENELPEEEQTAEQASYSPEDQIDYKEVRHGL